MGAALGQPLAVTAAANGLFLAAAAAGRGDEDFSVVADTAVAARTSK